MLDILLVALPLALFVALAAAFVLVYRRTAVLAAESRAADTFRTGVAEQAAAATASLSDTALLVDAVRRGGADPEGAAFAAVQSRSVIAAARGDVERLRARGPHESTRAAVSAALSRADEALAAAVAACRAVVTAPRDAEAQTAVKRAYLGIIHARDGIADLAEVVARGSGAADPGGAARDGTPPVPDRS